MTSKGGVITHDWIRFKKKDNAKVILDSWRELSTKLDERRIQGISIIVAESMSKELEIKDIIDLVHRNAGRDATTRDGYHRMLDKIRSDQYKDLTK